MIFLDIYIDYRRRKLVSELVTTMCDRNQVEMLMRFNFVGCTHEVEAALGFKARNADPLQRPLYSQIMYSWYIKRGDYRNGVYAKLTAKKGI